MKKSKPVFNINEPAHWPNGFTISDNRIEDFLQRFISPSAYVAYRHYLRFWGSNRQNAYPSLATLKERTGMSEKTIRKANKELVKKGFIKYIRGGPNRSNLYKFEFIECILKRYQIEIEALEADFVDISAEDINSFKIEKEIEKIKEKNIVQEFLEVFKSIFMAQKSFIYPVEASDIKAIARNINNVAQNIDDYKMLVEIFFKSRNPYIQKSDYSIFFFFTAKVQKILFAEFGETPEARWKTQSEKAWQNLRLVLDDQLEDLRTDLEIIAWIQKYTHFSRANQERDNFVIQYLLDKVKHYLSPTS